MSSIKKQKKAEEITDEQVLEKKRYRRAFFKALRSTIYGLICIFAVSLLITTLVLPVIWTYGNSMAPAIEDNSLVVCWKTESPKRGDVLAFYYNNRIVFRRVIGLPGDVINIDADGWVTVNGEQLQENYVSERSDGDTDLDYPYTVPEDEYFVLADDRTDVKDSRNSSFGNAETDNFIGKIFLCVWPFSRFGLVH